MSESDQAPVNLTIGNEPAGARPTSEVKKMSESEQDPVNLIMGNEPAGARPTPAQTAQVHPSDCGCAACAEARAGAPLPRLVYALGTLGIDFGTEARRDSILQHAGAPSADVTGLLEYLDKNPWEAQSLFWTLNLDSTPVYAVQPEGAFAAIAYDRMRQFLREQVVERVERVSVPGVVSGRTRLLSGQVVPTVIPDLRGMNNWNTAALAETAVTAASGPARDAEGVASFLSRIYYGLRNLGITSQERALNFAATNALNAAKVFETALKDGMRLDAIEVERSPVCRPESDCWDVKMLFFDPEHQWQRARVAYRFTVDVSDINPVMVGQVRSWPLR